ncbi:protein RER1 [Struthio camelus]
MAAAGPSPAPHRHRRRRAMATARSRSLASRERGGRGYPPDAAQGCACAAANGMALRKRTGCEGAPAPSPSWLLSSSRHGFQWTLLVLTTEQSPVTGNSNNNCRSSLPCLPRPALTGAEPPISLLTSEHRCRAHFLPRLPMAGDYRVLVPPTLTPEAEAEADFSPRLPPYWVLWTARGGEGERKEGRTRLERLNRGDRRVVLQYISQCLDVINQLLTYQARMSEGDSIGESVHGKPSMVYRFFTRLGQLYQSWLDKSTPYTAVRWIVTLGLSFIYMIRVYLLQGWYIVTYALGIYHLNLFIAFLSPKVDPSLMEDSDDGPSLPTKQNEEFRPFIRRLPEFKFWHSATKGILVAMACTFFEAFNVPVFWPILVMYFIMLFCITMKRQIKHMIKYRYIPFTHGKRKYKGKEDVGKTFAS